MRVDFQSLRWLLRDLFAAAALVGLLRQVHPLRRRDAHLSLAHEAYEIADAMLAGRAGNDHG